MRKQQLLGEMSLFQGLPSDDLDLLSREAAVKTYRAGETIFRQGEPAKRVHVVIEGAVKLFRSLAEGKEQTLYLVEKGEPFCLCTIYAGETGPVSAVAMRPSRIVSFPGPAIERQARKTPQLLLNILRLLNVRLISSFQMIENLGLRDISQRTASFLLHTLRARAGDPLQITLPVPRREVAKILGTTPETISRVLARMAQDHIICARGRNIQVLDLSALESIAG